MSERKSEFGGKIRLVIYDCDGVLFDSLEANRRFYNFVCQAVGRPLLDDGELRYVHTHTVQEAIRHLCREGEESEKKAWETVRRIGAEDFLSYMTMEPNLLPALSALKEKGIRRAICTSRTTSMERIMNRFGLWPYFDLVVTALDVENPKPHSESVEKILGAFDLPPEEAVFIGDAETDQKAAASSGVGFIAYKNPHLAADAFIDDHLALFDVLPF